MELTPEMIANKWKPGDIPNPAGNHDRHSTRPIAKRIAEFLEGDIPSDFEIDDRFKSRKAKEALIQALFERAVKQETGAAKLLIEQAEGRADQNIDLRTLGKSLSPAGESLKELAEKIRQDV